MSFGSLPPLFDQRDLPLRGGDAMRGFLLKDVQHIHDAGEVHRVDRAIRVSIEIVDELDQSAQIPFELLRTRMVFAALRLVQRGKHHPSAKQLKGDLRGLIELVDDFDGDTYRAIYTVNLAGVVYVLHVFQKKATHGIATPQRELALI